MNNQKRGPGKMPPTSQGNKPRPVPPSPSNRPSPRQTPPPNVNMSQIPKRSLKGAKYRSSGAAYKNHKLSRARGFAPKKVNKTLLVVILCVLATFFFAVILGNILGDKAQNSQNGFWNNSVITPPSPFDQNTKFPEINAYFADMTGAIPEISLSEQTGAAREAGNALLINLQDGGGKIMYNSDKTRALSYSARDNLTLSRLINHFEYYNDYAIGYFKSDFSPTLDADRRAQLSANEAMLLCESTGAFSELVVEFSGKINDENVIHYQSYLLNLNLLCEDAKVGIALPFEFCRNKNNATLLSSILNMVDFFTVDLSDASAEELPLRLDEISHIRGQRPSRIIISSAELDAKVNTLRNKNFDSFIVK